MGNPLGEPFLWRHIENVKEDTSIKKKTMREGWNEGLDYDEVQLKLAPRTLNEKKKTFRESRDNGPNHGEVRVKLAPRTFNEEIHPSEIRLIVRK